MVCLSRVSQHSMMSRPMWNGLLTVPYALHGVHLGQRRQGPLTGARLTARLSTPCPEMSANVRFDTSLDSTARAGDHGLAHAAEASGINEKTLQRWLREDTAFQAAYREARRAVVQHAITQVQRATGEVVETLRNVMQDAEAPASSRVAAARVVLDMSLRAIEIEDVEQRVAALEAQGARL